jgi:hypothetical protein
VPHVAFFGKRDRVPRIVQMTQTGDAHQLLAVSGRKLAKWCATPRVGGGAADEEESCAKPCSSPPKTPHFPSLCNFVACRKQKPAHGRQGKRIIYYLPCYASVPIIVLTST